MLYKVETLFLNSFRIKFIYHLKTWISTGAKKKVFVHVFFGCFLEISKEKYLDRDLICTPISHLRTRKAEFGQFQFHFQEK